MNTQKTVNERIAKVALKNQKVDLALMDDLKSQNAELQKNTSKLLSIQKEFVDNAKKLKSFGEILQEQGRKLRDMANDLDEKAKALGIDSPKEVGLYIDQANSFISTGKEAVKKASI